MRNVSCTLSDSETLVAKEVKSVPVTYWELEIMLGMFGNLLIVLLGTTHTVVVAYKEMWQLLKSSLCEDFHAALEYRAHVKPTHVLCSIQLTMYSWFSHRRARLTNSTDTGLKIYYSSNPDASLCTAFAASPIVPTCLPQETLLDVSTRVSRDGVNVVFGHQWLRFGPVLAQFPYNPSLPRCPLAYTDVYIDDFLLLAQCPCHTSLMYKDHFGVDC